jgi:hypothetical protein
MTPEEMTFWKDAIQYICFAWCVGALFIGIGTGSISIKNIIRNAKDD